MKTILITLFSIIAPGVLLAQDFTKHLAEAKSLYSAGKLEDSRFAIEQTMQELDITVGKEVLKLLPAKLDALAGNSANDNVSGATGFVGVIIHRDYGVADKKAEIDMITNSPLIASINTILAIPFVGNSKDGTQKRIKLEGYKGLLQKNVNSQTNKTSYELQIPFSSTLLTFKVNDADEDQVMKMAALIPMSQIAKMLQ
ncbi:MAG: hypothetical protein H7Y07_08210 [Pyrinomonadaceae bacterium]|nr:hypothetical protein [Sphingobacteriaceae bacterium]